MPSRAGSPNKAKNAALLLLRKKLGDDFHPLQEMGNLYKEQLDLKEQTDEDTYPRQFELLKEICTYTLPKLRAVEHSGELSHSSRDLTDDELRERIGKISTQLGITIRPPGLPDGSPEKEA